LHLARLDGLTAIDLDMDQAAREIGVLSMWLRAGILVLCYIINS
jgi:hypothetical protein